MKRTFVPLATFLGFVIAAVSVPTLHAQTAPAQGNTTGQALEIAPPVINLTANPGQTIKTEINLRDVSSGKLVVTSEINDFVAAGEDGTPKILLDQTESSPYSLKDWISPLAPLTLNPREIKKLPVTIKVPANAAPGGYYGVIRFTATPPELEGTGVSLSASLGSLLLVRVNGAAKEELKIESFTVNSMPGGTFDAEKDGETQSVFQSLPVQFIQRVRNTGNVHEQPAGQVVIKNMFGKTVAAVNVNLPPRNILPASVRKFKQPLDESVIGKGQFFGRYTAELKLTYGASKQTVSQKINFWVIPYTLIAGLVVGLVALFIGLRYGLKRYNRAVIKKAQQRSRRKR